MHKKAADDSPFLSFFLQVGKLLAEEPSGSQGGADIEYQLLEAAKVTRNEAPGCSPEHNRPQLEINAMSQATLNAIRL